MNLVEISSSNDVVSIAFQSKQEKALKRSVKFIAKWLKENKIMCHELFFDKKLVSEDRDIIKFLVRAVDSFNGKTYIFDLSCIKNIFQISYASTSQNPANMRPGEWIVNINDIINEMPAPAPVW
jgi:hypothetical protein